MSKKFFKDPKITIVSCKEFLESCNYLHDCNSKTLFSNVDKIIPEKTYYKITDNLLISIEYDYVSKAFGSVLDIKCSEIVVAFRNGEDEYHCVDEELNTARKLLVKHPKSKKIAQTVRDYDNIIKYLYKRLPPFSSEYKLNEGEQDFSESLVFDLFKSTNLDFAKEYVVLDLETNGLRYTQDDVLSITIFDPKTGVAYNRFLPLELQPIVTTKNINGIDDEMLKNQVPLSQKEFDSIVDYFDLKNRVILTYSGGAFDQNFMKNYCRRHKIIGAEELCFKNIKEMIVSNSHGGASKDNLCKCFGIDGATDIHTGLNDCILEWKLFEKIYGENLIIILNNVYYFSNDYIVPITMLLDYKNLAHIAHVTLPKLDATIEKIYEYKFKKATLENIQKFGSNIDGIAIENIIYSMLNVEKYDNYTFLTNNKKHLKHIGYIEDNRIVTPINVESDGSLRALNPKDEKFVNEVNKSVSIIKDNITPVIKQIQKIFNGTRIMSQECVISNDGKVLALCDLSNENIVMEIKTYDCLSDKDKYYKVVQQLYHQSKGRDCYVLSILFDQKFNLSQMKFDVNSLKILIHKIEIKK